MVTPANTYDCQLFMPLFSAPQDLERFPEIRALYGDNAYDSESHRTFLEAQGIEPRFHTKDETGKTPKMRESAKRKSKKHSKIEVLFGIFQENLGFGAVKVRRMSNVRIDTVIIFSGRNVGILYAYFMDKIEDRISLKELLYKN